MIESHRAAWLEMVMWLTETSKNLVVRMGLFFCYIFLGAVIFQALEAKNEMRERTALVEAKKHIQIKYNISDRDLKEFLQRVEKIVDHGFSKQWVRRWNLLGSLFFSGTVVTTIGKSRLTLSGVILQQTGRKINFKQERGTTIFVCFYINTTFYLSITYPRGFKISLKENYMVKLRGK